MDRDALVQMLARALEGTDVRLAILFGSRARGTAEPDSDVDVAVLAPSDTDLVGLSVMLERVVGAPVDVTSLDGAPYPLLIEVLRDGIRAHEGTPGAYARWMSETLCDLETDLPVLRRMQAAFTARVARQGLG